MLELRELAFHLLVYFWETTTPNKPPPKRDQLVAVIDKICDDILNAVDDDNNQEITRDEFDAFGKYAMRQWKAVEAKILRRTQRCNKRRQNRVNMQKNNHSIHECPIPNGHSYGTKTKNVTSPAIDIVYSSGHQTTANTNVAQHQYRQHGSDSHENVDVNGNNVSGGVDKKATVITVSDHLTPSGTSEDGRNLPSFGAYNSNVHGSKFVNK